MIRFADGIRCGVCDGSDTRNWFFLLRIRKPDSVFSYSEALCLKCYLWTNEMLPVMRMTPAI